MNLFYLDHDVKTCASYHCDKHAVKMIVELAQMLSTAQWINEAEVYGLMPWDGKWADLWREISATHLRIAGHDENLAYEMNLREVRKLCATLLPDSMYTKVYAPTHINHPTAVWVRSSKANYEYTCKLGIALAEEYTYRYHRRHKTQDVLEHLSANVPCTFSQTPFVQPPLAMPDDVKCADAIDAYRTYYKKYKRAIAVWRHTPAPHWF